MFATILNNTANSNNGMEQMDKWRKAGKIAAQALEYGKELIKNGAVIRDVCDKIDAKIVELGALPAWPSQIGLDSIAAHATPDYDDQSVFENNIVCLDVGAHIDGCVGDNALTVDLSGEWGDLLKAAKDALKVGIETADKGVSLGEIGKNIQEAIQSHNFSPIRNLSGHGISEWTIHDSPSIPNIATGDNRTLEGDQIIAIEPFATNGAGSVYEMEQANIFALENPKPVRSPFAREVLKFIEENYGPLPFATRWLVKEFGAGKTNLALRELQQRNIVHAHPPLVERAKGNVAVFEKTIYIGDQKEILTR